jgi:hypothetical protein
MNRIDFFVQEVYGDGGSKRTYTKLICRTISNGDEEVAGDHNGMRIHQNGQPPYIAISFLQQPPQSATFGSKWRAVCHTTVGLLLVCLYMSSYKQLHHR